MRSEVANATGNFKYNLNTLWTSPESVLVRGCFVESFANRSYICNLTDFGLRSFTAACTR